MIPAPFDYVAADSAAHAIELLASYGDEPGTGKAGSCPMMS